MAYEWDPALSVGVEEIDVQHRQILRRLQQVGAALTAGRWGAVHSEVRFLERYLGDHCAEEERWMAANGYPGAPDHERAHRAGAGLAAAVRDAAAQAVAPGADPAYRAEVGKLVHALGAWLDAHLRTDDARLGRYRVSRENLRRLAEGGRPALTPVPGFTPLMAGEAPRGGTPAADEG